MSSYASGKPHLLRAFEMQRDAHRFDVVVGGRTDDLVEAAPEPVRRILQPQVVRLDPERVERLAPVGGQFDVKGGTLQEGGENPTDVRLILGD